MAVWLIVLGIVIGAGAGPLGRWLARRRDPWARARIRDRVREIGAIGKTGLL